MATATSYDEIPYESKAFGKTHPDVLATAARLCGLTPANVEHSRILELGCSNGGNLIPIAAALPASRCVGIDLSSRQIEDGVSLARDIGVENIQLKAMSILDVDDAFGEFDFIICHGVFSWVPHPVQDKIFEICRKNLAPQGVAYISYNTYPGWHLRGMVREMFQYHTRSVEDSQERVVRARSLLEFLKNVWEVRSPDSAFGRVIKEESVQLDRSRDTYVFHEHLEEVNDPLYFHQFAERATAADLQYMWELGANVLTGSLPPGEQQALDQLSTNLIEREQYFDFIRNRMFRRTLLCHADVSVRRVHDASAVAGMFVSAQLRPVSENPDLKSTQPEEFRSADESLTATTNRPILKRLLVELYNQSPASVSVLELSRRVTSWRSEIPQELADNEPMSDYNSVAEQLLKLHLSEMAELHVYMPPITTTVSERPIASPAARQMALRSSRVTNLRHFDIELDDLDRFLLHHLDGHHTAEELLELVLGSVKPSDANGNEAQPLGLNSADARRQLDERIRTTLARLAQHGLLIGQSTAR